MSLKNWAVQAFAKLNRYLPSPHRIGGIYQTAIGSFAVPEGDLAIADHLRRGRHFDELELEMIGSVLKPESRILVVGTHVGTLAIPLARKAQLVVAIEANPMTFKYLSANVALNGVTNMTLHQVAAGEAQGTIEFVANIQNTGGSKRMPKVNDKRYFYDTPDRIVVPMARLDDLLPGAFDVIVMDIEGSEYFALQGMPRILSRAEHLFVEFLPHHLENVSGASPEEFWSLLAPHFQAVHSPATGQHASDAEIPILLRTMYDSQVDEPSLHFSRHEG